MKTICAYCGTEYDNGRCPSCGAQGKVDKPEIYKSQPFFWGGFMVVREYCEPTLYTKFHLFKGEKYYGTINIPRYLLNVEKYQYIDPTDLFKKMVTAELGDTVWEWEDERDIHCSLTITQIDVGEEKYKSFMEALDAKIAT